MTQRWVRWCDLGHIMSIEWNPLTVYTRRAHCSGLCALIFSSITLSSTSLPSSINWSHWRKDIAVKHKWKGQVSPPPGRWGTVGRASPCIVQWPSGGEAGLVPSINMRNMIPTPLLFLLTQSIPSLPPSITPSMITQYMQRSPTICSQQKCVYIAKHILCGYNSSNRIYIIFFQCSYSEEIG